ncbi:hypothetical protein DAETH_48740 (plasmid) [Deinococcus aetherius]|uniref:DUF4258 domain-containing protein n=1 Tax=Deinococcus aetherius TaxID=200252 RepID=A0ABN6RNN6_9DEIO|nr:DUF4258 domain-containing protein [Deinococcus aetherius]BDP44905.1 hypothetical protein DAETH_48740 [Deinococcus aetherius]
MIPGFDFSTTQVLEWELDAIWKALDEERLIFSRHAREELSLDALTLDDVLDAINFPDEVSKDLPGGPRAPGLNFDRFLGHVRLRAKVGWRDETYIVVTVMAN